MSLQELPEDAARERGGDGADVLLEFGDVLVAEGIAVDAGFGEAELEGDVQEVDLAVDGPLAHGGGARDVIGVGPASAGGGLGDGSAGEDAADDGEAVEDADAEFGRVVEEATGVGGALAEEVVVGEGEEDVDGTGVEGLAVEVMGAHAEADVADEATVLEAEGTLEGTTLGEDGSHVRGVMEEEGVEVVDVEELELVLDIADDILGGAGVVELEGGEDAVEAEAGGDDDAIAVDPLEGEAELAEGVAVAASAVEVVDTEVDGMVDEGDGGVIGDIAEVVAEALGAERDDGNRQPGLAPGASGYLRDLHLFPLLLPRLECTDEVAPTRPWRCHPIVIVML